MAKSVAFFCHDTMLAITFQNTGPSGGTLLLPQLLGFVERQYSKGAVDYCKRGATNLNVLDEYRDEYRSVNSYYDKN
jgi:hypothetical protein